MSHDDIESPFEVRGATPADFDALAALAGHLDTVNLPDDPGAIRDLLDLSARSFDGSVAPALRKYVLLLWDHDRGRAVATSSVIGKLGRTDAPYIYLDVLKEEKYSASLEKHFKHTALRMGYSYDGPTELGGLVVHPDYRRHPRKLGRLIAYSRFLLIAAKRSCFEKRILAELLPPLTEDGRSHLWEAFGRRFTQMTYSEADLLSSRDKNFVKDLFPSGIVYASVLSDDAQSAIGQVGEQSKPIQRLLERLGFRYARRVDPFDGGPHFVADTDAIPLVKNARSVTVTEVGSAPSDARSHLVASMGATAPFLRLVETPAWPVGSGVGLSSAALASLAVARGSDVWCVPVAHDALPYW